MLRVFKQVIGNGNGTQPYPGLPEAAPPAFRGQVLLDTGRCRGDGACVSSCPSAAIRLERDGAGWTWTLLDTRCVSCGLCAEACPHDAITLSTEFERAVRDGEALVQRIRFVAGEGRS